jgi:hypothetical protein
MMIRKSALVLPLFVLAGCMDRAGPTGPTSAAFEVTPQSFTHVVQNTLDAGEGSLRHAITAAANGHNITFAPELAGDTIFLESGQLAFSKSLNIVGPPGGIVISGSNTFRVFHIQGGTETVLENLTIRDGDPSTSDIGFAAGGVRSTSGHLIIRNSTISNNWAPDRAAGLEQIGGMLTLVNSTVANNGVRPVTLEVTGSGGGVRISRGMAHIINSTISGNSVTSTGGGVQNFESTVTITNSTIADNGATFGGGLASFGSFDFPATTSLVNSIVARNFASSVANGTDIRTTNPDFVGLFVRHSLIGAAGGHTLDLSVNNIIGVDPTFELDALNKPLLADNGGSTMTHKLLAGSPAIGAADPADCPATDQRGVARKQGGCDMGAYETDGGPVAPSMTVTAVAINTSGTVDKSTGVAYVSGTMSCTGEGMVSVEVQVSQEQKEKRLTYLVVGSALVDVPCAGSTTWAAAVSPGGGVFSNGLVATTVATQNVDPSVEADANVRLFWSK